MPFCHQKGHWKKDCPKLKNKDNDKFDANIGHNGDDDSEFNLTIALLVCHSDEWILDSGCTYHMCPNREWFFIFQELDGGTVLIGNDSACKSKGIGKIYLKMHDGAVRVLTDVRYVPDLKKNLISLGALDSKNFKITMEGVLKVVYSTLVLMKGVRRGNLYFLQWSTIVGAATVSNGSNETVADITNLWHMRRRHAGERALQGLVKQGLLQGTKACKLGFCEHCVFGKQIKVKFGTVIHHSRGTLDYIHSDV
eukprot:TRINITY_DN15115_c1_g1_i1.p1 TRINITY_DN15115_c1_g1~~TRINITY_DN15115_c1_g1_i1.p1  ORF type:complete len:252 (+),score=38.81 TRINITY_DN15115_c1_g1_i1:1859-2614(+)